MPIKHFKYNKLSVLAVICFTILFLIFKYVTTLSHQQNAIWLQHTSSEINKTILLSDILSNIGYGGFIHNFKNSILRLDVNKMLIAKDQIKNALNTISTYKNTYPSNSLFLDDIEKTLLIYQAKAEDVEQLINNGENSKSIDKKVFVDDTFAIESTHKIITFRNGLAKTVSQQSLKTEEYLNYIIWLTYFLVTITLGVFIFITYFSLKESNKHLNKQKILFELAPLAILAIDEDGTITSANKEAYKIFNAKDNSLINSSIDELTPDNVKNHHKKFRENFQRSEKISPMSERGKTFEAKKCDGEVFQANISIATYDQGNLKEAIAIIQDMTDYIKAFKDAHTDTLTNLPNRRDIETTLSKAISLSKREDSQLYIALIDIDFFKKINDDFGHDYGDSVLKNFASFIQGLIRESDFVGRWGGEEFLIIIEKSTDEDAFNLCEKIRVSIENYFTKQKRAMTVSIGLTKYIRNEDKDILFKRVDDSLYKSKENGRNQTNFI